jgi:hypothetical protein
MMFPFSSPFRTGASDGALTVGFGAILNRTLGFGAEAATESRREAVHHPADLPLATFVSSLTTR